MAVLNPGRAAPPAPAPRRVLLVARDEELDSLLALRRVAAHLTELEVTGPEGAPPDVALVCDDEAAAGRLLDRGVPVVHLRSGHSTDPGAVPGGALHRVHRPGWLPGPWPAPPDGVRTTGALAPARTARSRDRHGTLLLLSAHGTDTAEWEGFTSGPLRELAAEAVRRTGRCAVVCDRRTGAVRDALEGLPGVRVGRAADTDVDALHAGTALLLAAPVLGALALAQARRAPLVLLPPLGGAQRDLAGRVSRAVPLAVAEDPRDPSLWAAPPPGAPDPWSALDPAADDLRGAQRVARTLRQLSLAPL
ncbi:CGA synthase-related protein [Streptomyces sp. NPDC015131]|uniref:CGA synthase-related protein n=1 Tax=Streptomyces sp. NPDC015131 TaxID=3364941 RepID=UPI0036FCDE9E